MRKFEQIEEQFYNQLEEKLRPHFLKMIGKNVWEELNIELHSELGFFSLEWEIRRTFRGVKPTKEQKKLAWELLNSHIEKK